MRKRMCLTLKMLSLETKQKFAKKHAKPETKLKVYAL